MIRNVRNMPTSYEEAAALLDGRDQRAIANNTWVRRAESGPTYSAIQLGLHATAIVEWRRYGNGSTTGVPTYTVVLHNGGYETVTTKARMNAALFGTPYSIYAEQFVWYIAVRGATNPDGTPNVERYPFENGDEWPLS